MLSSVNVNAVTANLNKLSQGALPKAVTLCLVGLMLWLIAGAVWLLIPHPELPTAAAKPLTQSTSNNQDDAKANVTVLANRNLFGKATVAAKPTPKPANEDAPDTRLNVKLAGIILADDPDFSRALIADSAGKQKTYAIGDTIAGSSAAINEIHAEHVVLERNGRYEVLRLQKLTASSRSSTTSSSTSSSSASRADASVTTELKSVREQILKDPSKAGDFIRVRPVYSKGQLKGYRIYPGKDRALFRKVGLRSGDLVTSINGQNLNDPQKAFTMLSTLSSANSISLELQRRGRTENVSVDLGS